MQVYEIFVCGCTLQGFQAVEDKHTKIHDANKITTCRELREADNMFRAINGLTTTKILIIIT